MLFTEELQEKNERKKICELSDLIALRLKRKRHKYIYKTYQEFGVWIAKNLNDMSSLPLYIKLAKEQDKNLLISGVSFVKDYPNCRSKRNLFLWYLKGKLRKTKKFLIKNVSKLDLINGKLRKQNKK